MPESAAGDDGEIDRKWHLVECDCGYSERVDGSGQARVEGMEHEDHAGIGHHVEITRIKDGVKIHP